MKDTQDLFVDEVRQTVEIGSYSIGAICIAIQMEIKRMWKERGNERINIYLRSLIRGLRDLQK